MFQTACLPLLKLCINLHIPVSQELFQIALTEKSAGVTRTSFEAVYKHQYLDVYIDNFFLFAGVIDSA